MSEFKFQVNVRHEFTGSGSPVDNWWHSATGGGLPGRVWFRLGVDHIGRYVCTDVHVEGDDLTTSAMRSIPLSRIIEQLLKKPITSEERGGGLDEATGLRLFYSPEHEHLADDQARRIYLNNARKRPVKARPKNRRGKAGPSDDELARFASAHLWALQKEPRRHVAAAAERMNISPATAHRWLKLIATAKDEAN